MTNYVDELKESIAFIRKETKAGRMGRADRLKAIEQAGYRYVLAHNTQFEEERTTAQMHGHEIPYRPYDAQLLEQLANLALYEELTDKASNKSRAEEYPFLSDVQLARRQDGSHEATRKTQRGESPYTAAANIASDGRDYSVPTRRKRSAYEDNLRDEKAHSRNKERKRKYREFTKEQTVITYKLTQNVSY